MALSDHGINGDDFDDCMANFTDECRLAVSDSYHNHTRTIDSIQNDNYMLQNEVTILRSDLASEREGINPQVVKLNKLLDEYMVESAILKVYLVTGKEYQKYTMGEFGSDASYHEYLQKYTHNGAPVITEEPNDVIRHHKYLEKNSTEIQYYQAEATLWKEKYTQLLATTGGANVTSELDRLEQKIDTNHSLMFKFRADLKAIEDSVNFIKDHLNMVR